MNLPTYITAEATTPQALAEVCTGILNDNHVEDEYEYYYVPWGSPIFSGGYVQAFILESSYLGEAQ